MDHVTSFGLAAQPPRWGLSEDEVKEGLSEAEYAALAKAVLNSELNQHVTAALNRTLILEINWTLIQEDTTELIVEIEAELAN